MLIVRMNAICVDFISSEPNTTYCEVVKKCMVHGCNVMTDETPLKCLNSIFNISVLVSVSAPNLPDLYLPQQWIYWMLTISCCFTASLGFLYLFLTSNLGTAFSCNTTAAFIILCMRTSVWSHGIRIRLMNLNRLG